MMRIFDRGAPIRHYGGRFSTPRLPCHLAARDFPPGHGRYSSFLASAALRHFFSAMEAQAGALNASAAGCWRRAARLHATLLIFAGDKSDFAPRCSLFMSPFRRRFFSARRHARRLAGRHYYMISCFARDRRSYNIGRRPTEILAVVTFIRSRLPLIYLY